MYKFVKYYGRVRHLDKGRSSSSNIFGKCSDFEGKWHSTYSTSNGSSLVQMGTREIRAFQLQVTQNAFPCPQQSNLYKRLVLIFEQSSEVGIISEKLKRQIYKGNYSRKHSRLINAT